MCYNVTFCRFLNDFQISAEVSGEVAHATFRDTSIQEPLALLVISSLIAFKTKGIGDEIINW